jgi:chromosome segregation ATPase
MSVSNKHLATFLLGAAAAFGAYKYANLSDEDKEKMHASLKEKAGKLKDSALDAEDKAMEYFNELKGKGAEAFKEYMPKVEEFFEGIFNKVKGTAATGAGTDPAAGNTPGAAAS